MAKRTFSVERTIAVAAPPERILPLINDFHQWPTWSPWEQRDPDMWREYSGPDSGVGAGYEWSGNRKAGAGSMQITESVPGRSVVADLSFTKPFKASNTVTFTVAPLGDGAQVTWRMTGADNLLFGLLGRLVSMDKLVGRDFERGLSALKARAEAG